MMSSPLVSVLIPVRNAAQTLPAALASLFAQSLATWEAIIVDDGSTDRTPELLREHSARDGRIRIFRIAPSGIDVALNHGLAHCRAGLVARFDADDLMHRDRLAAQFEALNQADGLAGVASLVRCFPRRTLRDGLRRYEAWQNGMVEPEEIAAARFIESPLVHPSMMLRREVLETCGGWQGREWAEDWDLWLRLMEKGHAFRKVPRILHFWRDHPERLTRTDARYSLEAMMSARAFYLARGPLAGRDAVIWGAGPIGKSLLKALDRAGARIRALVDVDPRKLGQRIHGRRVIPPAELDSHRDAVLLAAVGAMGARAEIVRAAQAAGYVEGQTLFACA